MPGRDEPYYPGDVMTLDFEFDHEQNMERVTVVFVHAERPKRTIRSEAEPQVAENIRTMEGKRAYRSRASFIYRIEPNDAPGRYEFQSVQFHTVGGNILPTPDEINPVAGMGFEVGEESNKQPVITMTFGG